jgi:hypothetical protein
MLSENPIEAQRGMEIVLERYVSEGEASRDRVIVALDDQ